MKAQFIQLDFVLAEPFRVSASPLFAVDVNSEAEDPGLFQFMEQLVWSCRLEEPMKYGEFLRMIPNNEVAMGEQSRNELVGS